MIRIPLPGGRVWALGRYRRPERPWAADVVEGLPAGILWQLGWRPPMADAYPDWMRAALAADGPRETQADFGLTPAEAAFLEFGFVRPNPLYVPESMSEAARSRISPRRPGWQVLLGLPYVLLSETGSRLAYRVRWWLGWRPLWWVPDE